MSKPATYTALVLLVFLSSIPPINFFITNPSSDLWFVMILMAGFFGLFTLYIRTNWVVRAVAIISFILCFLSSSPYIAFTSYVSIVLCCYFYILCSRIEDWSTMFKAFQTILFLNTLLVVMQSYGVDSLLNFGLGGDLTCYGAIGQHMQMGSFSIVLSALLLPFSALNLVFPFMIAFFCTSTWTLLVAGVGVFLLFFKRYTKLAISIAFICGAVFVGYSAAHGKFQANTQAINGRGPIWVASVQLANQRPWTGWGPGTYKVLFPAMHETHNIPYKAAHNAFVQLLFEMGWPFTLAVIGGLGGLLVRLYRAKEMVCLTGVVMITMDAMVHFPDRMMQTVGLIICFLAYCEVRLKRSRPA